MRRTLTYTIQTKDSGQSILSYLTGCGYPRTVLSSLKKAPDGIFLNGSRAHASLRLCPDDTLCIRLTEEGDFGIVPKKGDFSVIYEDDDILVADKPPHMPVHPSRKNYTDTLANAVCFYAAQKGESYPFRCLNRLDRDTTGLTVISKNPLAAAVLSEEMRARQITRVYYALCEGKTPLTGTVDAPIARKEDGSVLRTVDFSRGETAVTHYARQLYDTKNDLSLVRLTLETGRTHQIRVHMSYIGHPLIGDFLYHPGDTRISRQALHAGELTLIHPVTKEKMHFSSELPPDIKCILTSV